MAERLFGDLHECGMRERDVTVIYKLNEEAVFKVASPAGLTERITHLFTLDLVYFYFHLNHNSCSVGQNCVHFSSLFLSILESRRICSSVSTSPYGSLS